MAREVPVSRNSTEPWQEQFPTGDPLLCSQRRVAQAPADSPIFAEHTGVGVRGRHFTDIPFFFLLFFPFFPFCLQATYFHKLLQKSEVTVQEVEGDAFWQD